MSDVLFKDFRIQEDNSLRSVKDVIVNKNTLVTNTILIIVSNYRFDIINYESKRMIFITQPSPFFWIYSSKITAGDPAKSIRE